MAETAQQTRRTRATATTAVASPAAFARALQESLDRRDQGQSR